LPSILDGLDRIRVVVWLLGRETELVCKFKAYTRPYIKVETKEGLRILHESVVKEIIPLDKR
jgi:hypothetical protein